MKKDIFTNKELGYLEKMENDLILGLFSASDKRDLIHRHIKRAYLVGRDFKVE